MEAFFTGVAIGFSLILAIGAQNAFVLRQGLLRQHFFAVALFCSLSDAILIAVGVSGVSWFIGDLIKAYSFWVFGAAAVWLLVYGTTHLRSAFRQNRLILDEVQAEKSLLSVLSTAALFTFGNPHVYLDTVILIGSASLQYSNNEMIYYIFGATLASVIFFYGIAIISKLFVAFSKNIVLLKVIDFIMGIILFIIAAMMVRASSFL